MAYAVIAKSGACTVNAGFTGVVFGDIIAHEISGVNTASPLDTSKIGPFNNPNSGADAVEGGNIAVQGADYIFAFVAGNSAGDTLSAGTGFVQRQYEHNSRPTLLTQDRVVGVAGKVPITFGVDNSGDTYAVGGMAFFPAGGAQVSSRSDALSDSRPSATSNHSFSFTTQKAVTGSSTITLALPRSAAPSAGRGTCWCRSAYP